MLKSPLTSALAERTVLAHPTLSEVAASVLAEKLRSVIPRDSAEMAGFEHEIVRLLKTPRLLRCLVCDLYKIVSVDPASDGMLQPLLFFKGFHAICLYHVARALWVRNGPADRFGGSGRTRRAILAILDDSRHPLQCHSCCDTYIGAATQGAPVRRPRKIRHS
jgi:hypothetical protein